MYLDKERDNTILSPSNQMMKAIAVIAFLAFFGIASASQFQRQAVECTPSDTTFQQAAKDCDFISDGNPANLCNDNCYGDLCASFKAISIRMYTCNGSNMSGRSTKCSL